MTALALGVSGGTGTSAQEEPAASEGTTGATGDTMVLLRAAGDDITAVSLFPAIAAAFLDDRGATGIRARPAQPPWTIEISGNLLSGRRIAVLVRGSSSRDAIRELGRGEVDIALAAREMTADERRLLAPLGDMTEPAVTVPLARAAVVIAVHRDNPVTSISFDQLRDIYIGRLTDWAALGGTPGPIHAFGRAVGAAARESIEREVMGDAPFGPQVRDVRSFSALHDLVAANTGAIGYLPVGLLDGLKPLRIAVAGYHARPDDYGVASGDYPLSLTMRLYRSPARTAITDKVFREATSTATEVAVLFAGFSRIKPQLLVPSWPDSIPADYREAVHNGLRVSVTIHFPPDTTEIDAAGSRQLDALAYYLRLLKVSAEKLRHIGFSENTGDPRENARISQQLAAIVAGELRRRKVYAGEVLAFGATLPLSSDAIPDGRRRNRRVETWILP